MDYMEYTPRTFEEIVAMKMKNKKPPLGILPRKIHDSMRLEGLKAAIIRYVNASCEIDPEWVKEYNELIKKVGD